MTKFTQLVRLLFILRNKLNLGILLLYFSFRCGVRVLKRANGRAARTISLDCTTKRALQYNSTTNTQYGEFSFNGQSEKR